MLRRFGIRRPPLLPASSKLNHRHESPRHYDQRRDSYHGTTTYEEGILEVWPALIDVSHVSEADEHHPDIEGNRYNERLHFIFCRLTGSLKTLSMILPVDFINPSFTARVSIARRVRL